MLKSKIIPILLAILLIPSIAFASEQHDKYTVKSGDTMWKIAVKHKIGTQEIIDANTQMPNPNLIYPNQVLNIPNIDSIKSVEQEVVRLVNIERQQVGLKPLKEDWELSRVARHKSIDMYQRGYFSHTSPTYGSPFDMIKDYGINYRSAGENIAQGYRTAQQVVNEWMNSSGHRANILNNGYTHIGVGYYEQGSYWTQMFISK